MFYSSKKKPFKKTENYGDHLNINLAYKYYTLTTSKENNKIQY